MSIYYRNEDGWIEEYKKKQAFWMHDGNRNVLTRYLDQGNTAQVSSTAVPLSQTKICFFRRYRI